MKLLVPFVFWCAAGLFLIGAYRLSPPGAVPGLSANKLANILYLVTTVALVCRTLWLGRSSSGCCLKERVLRWLTYSWLSLIIIFMFLGLNHLVRIPSMYERTSFFVSYLTLLGFLVSILCIIAYYKRRAGIQAQNDGLKEKALPHEERHS